jgi:phosphonate transport system permease protein
VTLPASDWRQPLPATTIDDEAIRARLLQEWPRPTIRQMLVVLVIVLAYAWGMQGTHADPIELAKGVPNILDFIRRLMPPQWEMRTIMLPSVAAVDAGSGFSISLPEIVFATVETIQMALIGTTVAIILAFPFGLLAARNTSPHRYVYQGTRLLLNANRAVPTIIFALVFVSAVGLGPFGGVLALAFGEIGIMGKLYAEAIEAVDPKQIQAVMATGAGRVQTFVYGVLPQALPMVASYALLLFETNVRSATVLGIVGAGGVGFVLAKYMALFQYQKLLGAMLVIIVTVTVIDRASDALRRRII